MTLPILARNRGGSFAAGPAAPAADTGYDLDDSYSISTTPIIHWDASTLVAENSAVDGSTFSTWTSREGSAYDLVQATGEEQFTYEATSSNMNGKPVAISSDAARHMMTAPDWLPTGTVTNPWTIILAHHWPSLNSNNKRFGGKAVSGSGLYHFADHPRYYASNWHEALYTNASGGTGGYLDGPLSQTGDHIITWELDNTATCHFYYDLVRTACSGTVSDGNPIDYLFSLGATNTGVHDVPTDTEFGEVIILNEVLSDTTMSGSNVSGGDLHTIISYLKNKYGI